MYLESGYMIGLNVMLPGNIFMIIGLCNIVSYIISILQTMHVYKHQVSSINYCSNGKFTTYVTGFAKIHCDSLVLQCSHARHT